MSSEDNQKNLLEITFKVLSSLIIPFGIYIVSMSTEQKLIEQKVQVQQERIEELRLKVKELNKSVAEGWSNIKLNTQEVRQMREMISEQSQMTREVYEYVLRQQGRGN
jgi:predicted  nucleic acid-binding Zn-ribbon protein